jgi:hypothetical protein
MNTISNLLTDSCVGLDKPAVSVDAGQAEDHLYVEDTWQVTDATD